MVSVINGAELCPEVNFDDLQSAVDYVKRDVKEWPSRPDLKRPLWLGRAGLGSTRPPPIGFEGKMLKVHDFDITGAEQFQLNGASAYRGRVGWNRSNGPWACGQT